MNSDLGRGESPQVSALPVALIIAGILVVLVLVAFGFEAIFRDRIGQTYVVRHPFPTPAVIPNERAERLALEAKQKKELDGGGGRMPIGDAMKTIAAKGDRAFDPIGSGP